MLAFSQSVIFAIDYTPLKVVSHFNGPTLIFFVLTFSLSSISNI
jgi:hypothetical protein